MHFPLERLENDSPYELFYTDMYQPISVDLAKYNELYHKYHPKMNYNFNESSFAIARRRGIF